MSEFTEEKESQINARFDALEKKNTDLEKQVTGAEELLQKHKTEIGDARKEFQAAMDKVDGIDKEKFKNAIDKLDAMEDNLTSSPKSRERGQGQDDPPADVRKLMTEEQKRIADEQFKQLPPEERIRVKGDPKEMSQFLNAAMEAAPSIPESLFDETDDGTGQGEVNKYRKMFGLVDQESSFVPGATSGGPTGFKGTTRHGKPEAEPTEKRLPTGQIPRPAPKE